MSEEKSVLFICLGNICRSPIAEAVFKHIAKNKGVENKWRVDSAAIGPWHVGNPMDPRAASTLTKHDITPKHTVRQIQTKDFNEFDYIFGMDNENMRALNKKAPAGSKARVELLAKYDPKGSKIIKDPYYDDDSQGFEECYQICYRACTAFLEKF